MSSEMKTFALEEARKAGDLIAEEIFKRAHKIDIDVVQNEYENVAFWFTFGGATIGTKWNPDDRFVDPDVVYNILMQLLYQAEDSPKPPEDKSEPEPLGFVWGSPDLSDDEESDEESDGLISEYWK